MSCNIAPPGPPTPKVTDWTKSTVDLVWIPPLKDGGSKIMGYYVEYKEEGTEAWVKVSDILLCSMSWHPLFLGLVNLHSVACYYFRPKRRKSEAPSLLFLD